MSNYSYKLFHYNNTHIVALTFITKTKQYIKKRKVYYNNKLIILCFYYFILTLRFD